MSWSPEEVKLMECPSCVKPWSTMHAQAQGKGQEQGLVSPRGDLFMVQTMMRQREGGGHIHLLPHGQGLVS